MRRLLNLALSIRTPEAWRRAFRNVILLEAAAAILFFGRLSHQPGLQRCGVEALGELKARGYEIPLESDPVRIYPAETGGSLSSGHAGGWRPGIVSLRENPLGNLGPEVYLRHELMHEAAFRTCSGTLPLWAEEAAAMDFSGELATASGARLPPEADLDHLRRRARIGARLDSSSYRTLAALVAAHGWPRKPCAVSDEIQTLLNPPGGSDGGDIGAVLISVISGRVLESKGDIQSRYPPGSLLKVVYAASLNQVSAREVGEELAASDTVRLLRRRTHLDLDRYRFFISMVRDSPLSRHVSPEEFAGKDERFYRSILGERDETGEFPLEANLPEIALMLRSSLLYRPESFAGLQENGFIEGTTLYAEPDSGKRVLRKLHAMSKTGTVSDQRGMPLVGHLTVAWPAEAPVYLAVFRTLGINGAGNLRHASRILEKWSTHHPVESGKVRVRLLSLAPRASWEILDDCPSFERTDERASHEGWKRRVSTCGSFRILSSSRKSRSERLVAGILESSPDGQMVVLETDAETYADAVMAAEAEDLEGEARKALRAVIVWNGTHGGSRHPESGSLCDSTHCMVFLGSTPDKRINQGRATAQALLKRLDELASKKGLAWLPFSKGGVEKWEKRMALAELRSLVNEPIVFDLRRERARSGEVAIHLFYGDAEEVVSCEVFRNSLKLPSCPDFIQRDETRGQWLFKGIGQGHGLGLSVENARALAQSGAGAATILDNAYE